MRIWSIHPKYLDSKGLVALWRETLLAKKVLIGLTKGYKEHPQLIRFKESENSLATINIYLKGVYEESKKRDFSFDISKIEDFGENINLNVTKKQLDYEFKHLLKKLKERDMKKYELLKNTKNIEQHPIFNIIPGDIENWEKNTK